MELVVLGSGTYEPEVDRHCSSYLVKVKDQNLVFDFGRGALDQLMKCGVHYYDIDTIFISHIHADHCSELASFLHIALAEVEKVAKRKSEVTIYGPEGFGKTIEHMLNAFRLSKHVPKYKVIVKELSGGTEVRGNGWVVKCFRAEHKETMESLIFRLESDEKSLVYTGDTKDCDGLREALRLADLAVMEASWPNDIETDSHLHGEEAGKIALVSNVRKLVLTHVAPYYMQKGGPQADARKYFKGKLFLAKDLMKISV